MIQDILNIINDAKDAATADLKAKKAEFARLKEDSDAKVVKATNFDPVSHVLSGGSPNDIKKNHQVLLEEKENSGVFYECLRLTQKEITNQSRKYTDLSADIHRQYAALVKLKQVMVATDAMGNQQKTPHVATFNGTLDSIKKKFKMLDINFQGLDQQILDDLMVVQSISDIREVA